MVDISVRLSLNPCTRAGATKGLNNYQYYFGWIPYKTHRIPQSPIEISVALMLDRRACDEEQVSPIHRNKTSDNSAAMCANESNCFGQREPPEYAGPDEHWYKKHHCESAKKARKRRCNDALTGTLGKTKHRNSTSKHAFRKS